MPKRKKEVNNCAIDSCGLGDISACTEAARLLIGGQGSGWLSNRYDTRLLAVVVQLPLFFMAHGFGKVGHLATLSLRGIDGRGGRRDTSL